MLHKILINSQETGMFMKVFLRYIRLSRYIRKKRKIISQSRYHKRGNVSKRGCEPEYIAEIHKVRKHAAIAFKCWFR